MCHLFRHVMLFSINSLLAFVWIKRQSRNPPFVLHVCGTTISTPAGKNCIAKVNGKKLILPLLKGYTEIH